MHKIVPCTCMLLGMFNGEIYTAYMIGYVDFGCFHFKILIIHAGYDELSCVEELSIDRTAALTGCLYISKIFHCTNDHFSVTFLWFLSISCHNRVAPSCPNNKVCHEIQTLHIFRNRNRIKITILEHNDGSCQFPVTIVLGISANKESDPPCWSSLWNPKNVQSSHITIPSLWILVYSLQSTKYHNRCGAATHARWINSRKWSGHRSRAFLFDAAAAAAAAATTMTWATRQE